MFRSGAVALVAVSLCGSAATVTHAEQRPRFLGGAKPDEYQPFQAPAGRFALEYPKRGWLTVPGGGGVLVVFSQDKGEAAAAVEHTALNQALAPDEITQQVVDLEVEHIGQRDTKAEGFRTALRTDTAGRRIISIDFTRAGIRGVERVRQYSLPIGTDLFRIICSSTPALFDKYAPVFNHMAETFKVGPGAAPAK